MKGIATSYPRERKHTCKHEDRKSEELEKPGMQK